VSASSKNALLIVISAPSGGGKTTVCQQLLANRPGLTRAITCTTRQPRAGETDGVDYYFLDQATFLKRVEAGDFLEHATVFGNSYGTLKSELLSKLAQGKDLLLAIDVQGVATIRKAAAQDAQLRQALVTVFLVPPSMEELERRLKGRGTEAPEVVARRLSMARQEIGEARHYDYVVVSQSIPEDLRRMLAIIEVEKMRTARVDVPQV
jgi:guanylate kinase